MSQFTMAYENSFDPTPKLKSSPIPINFIPFNQNANNCFYCGKRFYPQERYTSASLFDQKYCNNCFSQYVNDITDNNTYLDVHISTINPILCKEHETSRDEGFCTRNIKEWCKDCSFISYFKQIPTKFSACFYESMKDCKDCKLCGKLIYQLEYSKEIKFRLCSNCYLISSEWDMSLSCKKPILVLNLPWWGNFGQCLVCNLELKFSSDCQKWCSYCFIIYTGCRFCLTTNIIFGLSDHSRCRKCKKISNISTNIINNDVDAFLCDTRLSTSNNHKIADYVNSLEVDHDPSNIYDFIKRNYIDPESVMEWIPYSRILKVEKIAEGGFGIIYKAIWLGSTYSLMKNKIVAIKQLKNSQKISKEFLNELKSHHKCCKFGEFSHVLRCYGITKNPSTEEYMLIMQYAKEGDLHYYLQKNFVNIKWKRKIEILCQISNGLETIHNANFIHRDFHSGNILLGVESGQHCQIGDLGLSQPANDTPLNNEIYGVIPYIAPEIFNGSMFTKASDIYSVGIIMWECTTGCKPFSNVEHDTELIYKIIDGKRPEITKDTPECFANLMKRCWELDPKKRPSIAEICKTFSLWYNEYAEQFNQAEEKRLELVRLKILGPEFTEKPHPRAIYTSRPLRPLVSTVSRSSSINSTSFNMKKEYISKEYELDINNIQSSSSANVNSTQHQSAIYTSKPLLSKLIGGIKFLQNLINKAN